MNRSAGEPRLGRLASRILRRLAGFVLLCGAVGISTCSAFDTAMDAGRARSALEEARR